MDAVDFIDILKGDLIHNHGVCVCVCGCGCVGVGGWSILIQRCWSLEEVIYCKSCLVCVCAREREKDRETAERQRDREVERWMESVSLTH